MICPTCEAKGPQVLQTGKGCEACGSQVPVECGPQSMTTDDASQDQTLEEKYQALRRRYAAADMKDPELDYRALKDAGVFQAYKGQQTAK